MKVTKLKEKLEELIKEHGEDIDVQTFSCQLGIYKEWDEVERIDLQE
ncbi:hypothetical protein [Clostridium sp. BSD9I1]|nr:hypothetical protein [Clostridium sp. BSD9I1]